MITNQTSDVTADATPLPEVAANTEERAKPFPLLWIPVTLSVGLLIAGIYLAGRIAAAHRTANSTAQSTKMAPPAQPVTAVIQSNTPALVKPEVKPELHEATVHEATVTDQVPLIDPRPGERYLQVGALDSESTRRFVQRLQGENLEAHVAPGPRPELLRVLIGPFDNRDALNEKKAQIESEGLETFVREY